MTHRPALIVGAIGIIVAVAVFAPFTGTRSTSSLGQFLPPVENSPGPRFAPLDNTVVPEAIVRQAATGQDVTQPLLRWIEQQTRAHWNWQAPDKPYGMTLRFPAGAFVISAPIPVPPGVTLVGAGNATLIDNRGAGNAFDFWTPFDHGYHLDGAVEGFKIYSRAGGGIGLHPSVKFIERPSLRRLRIDSNRSAIRIRPPLVPGGNWAFGPLIEDVTLANSGFAESVIDLCALYADVARVNAPLRPRTGGATALAAPLFNFEGGGLVRNCRFEQERVAAPAVRFAGRGGDWTVLACHFETHHTGPEPHVEVDGCDLMADSLYFFHDQARLVVRNGGRVTATKRVEYRNDSRAIAVDENSSVVQHGERVEASRLPAAGK